jgi:outer membrane protein assembly factor BamB
MDAAILDELDAQRRTEFETHLAACSACRFEYQSLRAGLGVEQPPPAMKSVTDRILALGAVELQKERRLPSRRKGWVAAAVLTAAAAIAVVFFVRNSVPESGCACGDSWRFVDGDAANTRSVELSNFEMPTHILWEKKLAGRVGSYKPLAWRDLVIVGAVTVQFPRKPGGEITAFDARTGNERWSRTFASGDFFKAKGFPDRCVMQRHFYVTDGNVCHVLDASTGKELAVYSSPKPDEGWNYLGAESGRLYGTSRDGRAAFCVEAASGKTLWRNELGGEVLVPALSNGRIYFQTSSGAVLACNAADGRQLWQQTHAEVHGKGSVCVAGERLLVLLPGDMLCAFSLADGRLAWEQKINGAFLGGLALTPDAVYVSAGRKAFAIADGHLLWQRKDATSGLCAPPTYVGGQLLTPASSTAGSLTVLASSGESLGELSGVTSQACDGLIVAGGRVFAAGGGKFLALTSQ